MEGIYLISPSADVGYFDIEIPEQLIQCMLRLMR